MMQAVTVLICSVASLLGSIAVLIVTVRVHRAMDRVERARIQTVEIVERDTGFDQGVGPIVDARAPITACVPCGRYWVPSIYGPHEGEPCSECKKPVTRSPEKPPVA